MKPKAKKRVKTLWNKKSRKDAGDAGASRKTNKLIGRQTGGQWVEQKPGGGLKID